MGNRLIIPVIILFCMSFVLSTTTFQLNEEVNYRFRCYDDTGSYCSPTTVLLISVEYPNGTNALDNISMTYQGTYFNVTLPTDAVGENYQVLINSPTSNNTITEFPYTVTPTGDNNGIPYILANGVLFFLLVGMIISIAIITRKIDFKKWKDKITKEYEDKNPFKVFFVGMLYSLMKDTFFIYYLIGWPLLLVIEDLLYTFNIVTLHNLIVNMIDVYTVGIYIVLFLFVGSTYQFLKGLWDDFENMKWGVNE